MWHIAETNYWRTDNGDWDDKPGSIIVEKNAFNHWLVYLLTTVIILLIFSNLITEQGITEETQNQTIYADLSRNYAEKDPTTQNPIIQMQTLAVNSIRTPEKRSKTPLGRELPPKIDKYLLEVFGASYSESLEIIRCESTYNFKENRKDIDIGLFQINQVHFPEIPGDTKQEKIDWLLDYKNNIDFAKILYDRNGWGDFYMSYSCHQKI